MKVHMWWTEPIKDLSFFRLEGADNFPIASVLFDNGVIPVCVILCPSHSILSFAKWHLKRFIRRFSWSIFIRHCRTKLRCFSIPPLLTINISSKYYPGLRDYNQSLFKIQPAYLYGRKIQFKNDMCRSYLRLRGRSYNGGPYHGVNWAGCMRTAIQES